MNLFRIIVDKIDADKNTLVDLSELKQWITYTQRRYIEDDVDRQWKQHNPKNEDQISWEVSQPKYFQYYIFWHTAKGLKFVKKNAVIMNISIKTPIALMK